jgi:7-carboxy-7-deazaguanine synthase
LDGNSEILLREGKVLPLMEEFYSIQGEGTHTGKPAYFARIGGCDVGCHWCDIKESWDASKYPPVSAEMIAEHAAMYPAKAIVITGGEPLLYNLDFLCEELHKRGVSAYLETSGSSALSGTWDWICLSPKKDNPPVEEMFSAADELKVIIEEDADFAWAEKNAGKVRKECILILQPEWSERNNITPAIVDYVKSHPGWKVSLQSHKYMRVP